MNWPLMELMVPYVSTSIAKSMPGCVGSAGRCNISPHDCCRVPQAEVLWGCWTGRSTVSWVQLGAVKLPREGQGMEALAARREP